MVLRPYQFYAVPEEFEANNFQKNEMPFLIVANKAFKHFFSLCDPHPTKLGEGHIKLKQKKFTPRTCPISS